MSAFADEYPQGGSGQGGAIAIELAQLFGGLYDSHQNRKTSKENTNKTIAAQKAEAELAYQRQVQMWERQNLYNSPESQMARFKAGGLSPHLIYGQGSPGNAASPAPPSYQPANLQYRYEAPQIGGTINAILPTLMAVGTWVQNMRLTDAELTQKRVQTQRGETDIERARQIMDYMTEANPKMLREMENKNSLFPYQYGMQRVGAETAQAKLFEIEQDFRYKYGEDLFKQMGTNFTTGKFAPIGGVQRLKYLQEKSKTEQESSKAKLEAARASWSDFDITNPQAIIQLVLSGVLGMAGSALRLSAPKAAAPVKTRPTGVRRVHPAYRVRDAHRRD